MKVNFVTLPIYSQDISSADENTKFVHVFFIIQIYCCSNLTKQ